MVARSLIKHTHLGKLRLVCLRYGWSRITPVSACRQLRLASDLPALKQQGGWNRLRFTKWGRKYLLGSPGRIQLPEDSSSGSCMFSEHSLDNLTSQLHLLNIEILQTLRPLRSAAHEDNSLSSCLFFQAASGLVCESWLTEACKTFPVLERKGDQPAAGGK